MFDKYNRTTGYGQMAPGRDVEELDEQGQPKRSGANIQSAIMGSSPGGMPVSNVPFKGAQQTIGAKPPAPAGGVGSLFGSGQNTGIAGRPGEVSATRPGMATGPTTFTTQPGDSNPQFSDWLSKHPAPGLQAGWQMGGPNSAATEDWITGANAAQAAGSANRSFTDHIGASVNDPLGASPAGQGGFVAPTPSTPSPPPQLTSGAFHTRLMEGDPGKLQDPAHAAESPKYDFLQLAQQNKFNYDQLPQMLQTLQSGPNGRLWQGWTANRDKLTFTGDPSQLAPEWKGATSVDAIGAFGDMANGKDPQGWRWGVGGPNGEGGGAPGATAGGGAGLSQQLLQQAIGGGTPGQVPESEASYSSRLMQQIMQALQVDPQLAGIAKQSGY